MSRCLIATADLMGYSQLANIARGAGLEPVQVRGAAGLDAANAPDVAAILVDLSDPHGGPEAVQAAAKQGIPVIAVGPHVRQDLFEAAREAGAEQVLPHSAVGGKLGPILQKARADHDPGAHA